ncbi:protein jagunal homolog [Watersipora subatra]|uniref:protein jagunal homolog n=1 Tax=Watersipora subatra TaxID=2589382 RepID=UPI00355AEC8C
MHAVGKGRRPRDLFHEAKWCIFAEVVVLKVRIKWTIFFHGLLICVGVFRVVLLDILPNNLDTSFSLLIGYKTETQTWEYVWLLSTATAILSGWAIGCNHRKMLYFAIFGSFLLGVMPLCYGVWNDSHRLVPRALQKDKKCMQFMEVHLPTIDPAVMSEERFRFIVLQYYWMSLAIQVHLFHILFAYRLQQTLATIGTSKIM